MGRNLMTPKAVADLVARAIDAAPAEPDDREAVESEEIALLAEGRLDVLPPNRRERLLRQIAAQPEAAELLRSTAESLPAAGTSGTVDATLPEAFRAGPARGNMRVADRGDVLLRITRTTWSLAACLVITLGVWRVVSPPVAVVGGTENPKGLPESVEQPSFWTHRDIAFLAASGVFLVLSVPLAYRIVRRKP